jgi:GntR family transcriptional regulator, carbon starvation induced regulator
MKVLMPTSSEDSEIVQPSGWDSPLPPSAVGRETLTQRVEAALRQDILRGVFLPSSRIRGSEAKMRYGVSATPFREALQRLASDGFVEIDAQSGARVARVSRDDLKDIFGLRHLLEREALRRAIENTRNDDVWNAELSSSFERYRAIAAELRSGPQDRERVEVWSESHDRFYETLYSGCGSQRLQQLIWRLISHAQRYRAIALRLLETQEFDTSQIDELFDQVETIYSAASKHDAEEALKALEEHLNKGEGYLVKVLKLLEAKA